MLDSTLKRRDITLPTKFRVVKAMLFPVVMYAVILEPPNKVCHCFPIYLTLSIFINIQNKDDLTVHF